MAKRNSLDIGQDDINLTTTICGLMSRAYENEEERMKTVFLDSCFKDYFTMGSSSIQLYLRNMDVSLTIQDHPILIIEGKDEVRKGGGDSYFQSIAYYRKEITEETRNLMHPAF